MTVGEWFEGDQIRRENIEEMLGESDYSDKAANFVLQVWERDADELTTNQSAWAGRILEDMVERRISKQRRVRY